MLADEPTGSLDERSVDRILELFADLRRQRPKMTTILVTYDGRVAETADRIIHFRDGRVDYRSDRKLEEAMRERRIV